MVRHFRLKTCFPVFFSCVTLFLRDIFKNFLEPRFQSTSQFPPKNTYHMHTGHFSCDYRLRNIPKKFFRASLSCRLVSSRLEIPTTCTQDLFLHDYCLRDIPKKKISQSLAFMSVSQFPPKNNYHMHTGLFSSSCMTIVCVTSKTILQPHFNGGQSVPA